MSGVICHVSGVMRQVSRVRCLVSCVRCHVKHIFFGAGTWFGYSVEGLLSMRPTTSSFLQTRCSQGCFTNRCVNNSLKEIHKKIQSYYRHCTEGVGGSTLAQTFLGHFFIELYIWQHAKRGGGVKALPKDLDHFKRFNNINNIN